MPGGNRTGPVGMGPRTGRAAGYCSGFDIPGYANPVQGHAMYARAGRGGRGFRNRYLATGQTGWMRAAYGRPAYPHPYAHPFSDGRDDVGMTEREEKDFLKGQAESLEDQLREIRDRMNELEKAADKED